MAALRVAAPPPGVIIGADEYLALRALKAVNYFLMDDRCRRAVIRGSSGRLAAGRTTTVVVVGPLRRVAHTTTTAVEWMRRSGLWRLPVTPRVLLYVLPQAYHNLALIVWKSCAWIVNSAPPDGEYATAPWLVAAVRRAMPHHTVHVVHHGKQRHPADLFCLVWAVYALCQFRPGVDPRRQRRRREAVQELNEILEFVRGAVVGPRFKRFLTRTAGCDRGDADRIADHAASRGVPSTRCARTDCLLHRFDVALCVTMNTIIRDRIEPPLHRIETDMPGTMLPL